MFVFLFGNYRLNLYLFYTMADTKKNIPTPDKGEGFLVGKENGKTVVHTDGNKGGVIHGERHSNGGVAAVNTGTGQRIEVEKSEISIIPEAVNSKETHNFQGKELTNKQVLSEINQLGGGVPILRKGGEVNGSGVVIDKRNGGDIKYPSSSVIITRPSVFDSTKRMFDGKMRTNIEILSLLNEKAGGVAFSENDLPEKMSLSGATYEWGGKMTSDYEIAESCGCKHENGGVTKTYFPKKIKEDGVQLSPFMYDDVTYNTDKFKRLTTLPTEGDIYIITWEGWYHIPAKITEIVNARHIKAKDYIGVTIEGDEFKITDASKIWEIVDKELKAALVAYFDKEKMGMGGQTEIDKVGIGKLSKDKTLADIADIHGVTEGELKEEMRIGIAEEMMEHTDNKVIAMRIALDHLVEDPHYYTKMREFEEANTPDYDEHLEFLIVSMAKGGELEKKFSFTTPTGEPSKLTYLQQVLVRTKAFKTYFGDWETAAKYYLHNSDKPNADQAEVFKKYYDGVSKVLDFKTLEPRAVFHGTMSAEEFFIFDVTMEVGIGRPYAYFAVNKEYAENFTKFSQRQESVKALLYSAFLNIRTPFMAIGHSFDQRIGGWQYWLTEIKGVITYDKYGDFTVRKDLNAAIDSQIKDYVKETFDSDAPFWALMARDKNKDFKYFLMSNGFDGVAFSEEIKGVYDPDNPAEFTYAYTVFDARQIKLADGRNVNFDPMKADVRYGEGGKLLNREGMKHKESQEEKYARLRKLCLGDDYAHKKAARGGIYKLGGEIENKEKKGNFDRTNVTHNANVEYVNNLIARTKAH